MNVVTTYLKSDLKERVFVQQSIDFEKKNQENLVCFLLKILYELKQSSRVWYDTLANFMFNIDYDRLIIDSSMFIHKFSDMIVIIYVNDMLICDFKKDDILNFKEKLIERFRIKNFELISYYLSVKIVRDRKNRTMHLNQINYIRQFVEKCDLINCKSTSTSMK